MGAPGRLNIVFSFALPRLNSSLRVRRQLPDRVDGMASAGQRATGRRAHPPSATPPVGRSSRA